MQGCRIGILECGRRGVQFRFPPILVNRQLEFLDQLQADNTYSDDGIADDNCYDGARDWELSEVESEDQR